MGFAPDLGLKLKSLGMAADATWTFAPFHLFNITAVSEELFSTMSNVDFAGVEHAASLDFDYKMLQRIADLLPKDLRKSVEHYVIERDPPWVTTFPKPAPLIMTVKLGSIESNDAEDYLPLIVTKAKRMPKANR